MTRICIVTMPRCGSQLCETLIANTLGHTNTLGEYFENSNDSTYELINDRIVNVLPKYQDKIIAGPSAEIPHRLNLLELSTEQNITIRVFFQPIVHNNIVHYRSIFDRLAALDFKCIFLTRDFEDQILSFLIANAYQTLLGKDIWHMGEVAAAPIRIPADIGFVLRPAYVHFNSVATAKLLPTLLPEVTHVDYETMIPDLHQMLNLQISHVSTFKTIQTSPYNLIVNADEVRGWIKPFKELQ